MQLRLSLSISTALATLSLLPAAASAAPTGQVRITEWMYNTSGDDPGEFVELTNVGPGRIDLTGWSYDDDSRTPGVFSLSGFGSLAPGESVLLTELSESGFRTEWNLCSGIKVLGGYTNNLGRADEINIFDANGELVDRLTYGDNAAAGGPRTNGTSAWVSEAGLGANDAKLWTKSAVGDAEGSLASVSGSIGSPGKSTLGGFDACVNNATGGLVRITEWMYDGSPGEYVELTNIGAGPADLTGWSFDDDSRTVGGFDLSGFGTLAPGESVVFTEVEVQDFRSAWDLCDGVKILGGYTNNLGRADEINIFNASGALVDRLTYGDNTAAGGPRTTGASAWVSPAGLGANVATQWTKSTVGDREESYANSTDQIGSPGTSGFGGYDACSGSGGGSSSQAPTITVPSAANGVLGASDNQTVTLTVGDADSEVADLVVQATSSNTSVLPVSGIVITGTGETRTVSFTPAARGVSTVTFTVADPEGNSKSANLTYGASNAVPDASGHYYQGIGDASGALDVGDGYVLVVNDENNPIGLYKQGVTGAPVKTWTFTQAQLGSNSELDFEGIARFGDLVVITGSHGNNREGEIRTERRTLIAATISGSGASTELTFAGRYNGLWSDLLAWDAANGDELGFAAAAKEGVLPNAPDGFNIEGLEFSPDGSLLYLGFRAPTVQRSGKYLAVIVPVTNAQQILAGTPGTGPAKFADPILVDLDGRSIRAIASNDQGDYLISAGASPQNDSWALYTWTGKADEQPQFNRLLPIPDELTTGVWEAIATVPHPLAEGAIATLVTDSGDSDFYGTGATKDLIVGLQKSYTQEIALAAIKEPGPPTWSQSLVYLGGAQVTYNESVWEAAWWTQGQKPGDAYGPWQEIVKDADGNAVWTATRIFTAGSVVVYAGKKYKAKWYTRNQKPGDPNGPWELVN